MKKRVRRQTGASGTRNTLGCLVRRVRAANGWTLRELSGKVDIPESTLSKVETGRLTLTYDRLQQFASRLGMSMAEFLAPTDVSTVSHPVRPNIARRSLATVANRLLVSTRCYDFEYLCAELRDKRFVPIVTRVRAHDTAEVGEPMRQEGEEFVYVLKGSIEVHLQYYASVTLAVGEGIYFDSAMEYAYTAKDCESALVLRVHSSETLIPPAG